MNNKVTIKYDGFIAALRGISYKEYELIQQALIIPIEDELYHSLLEGSKLPLSENEFGTRYLMYSLKGNVVFPAGLIHKVSTLISGEIYYESLVKEFPLEDKDISSALREHQIEAVKGILQHKRLIVKSPTGSGKSYIAGEVIRLLQGCGSILLTVPTELLLYQMKKDVEEYFERNGETIEVGLIGDGNYSPLPGGLTIAIPNTLSRRIKTGEVLDFLKGVRVLIGDEIQKSGNLTYITIAQHLRGLKWSIGMSATPWIGDMGSLLLEGIFGPKSVEIGEQEMIDKGIIMKPTIRFYPAPKGACAPKLLNMPFSHWRNNLLYNQLIVKNKGRNELIVKLAMEYLAKEDRGSLVIVVNKVGTTKPKKGDKVGKKPPISHALILQELFTLRGIEVPILHGLTKKKEKDDIMSSLSQGKIPLVIVGPEIFTAGVSINNIGGFILAGAGKSDTNLIQRIGRALRIGGGDPIIYDFIDTQSYFSNQSTYRMEICESIYPGCVEVV